MISSYASEHVSWARAYGLTPRRVGQLIGRQDVWTWQDAERAIESIRRSMRVPQDGEIYSTQR